MLLAVVLTLAAHAGPVDDWLALHDALLSRSIDGDSAAMARGCQRLVHELPGGDPLRAEALYWLGESRIELGDVDGAREALREGVRTGCPRDRCLESLGQLELAEAAVRRVPTRWTFDSADHGVVHSWRYADQGTIRLDEVSGEGALVWSTDVGVRSEDQLVVAFRKPEPEPERVLLRLQALDREARLRLVFMDVWGQAFTYGSGVVLPPGDTVDLEVRLDELTPLAEGGAPMRPGEVERLLLTDVTAYFSPPGSNRVALFELAVR